MEIAAPGVSPGWCRRELVEMPTPIIRITFVYYVSAFANAILPPEQLPEAQFPSEASRFLELCLGASGAFLHAAELPVAERRSHTHASPRTVLSFPPARPVCVGWSVPAGETVPWIHSVMVWFVVSFIPLAIVML